MVRVIPFERPKLMVAKDLTLPGFGKDLVGRCYNFSDLDAAALLAEEQSRNSRYATAPFDRDGNVLRFYPGGITIWSGFPGSGKTTMLRQLIAHTLARGSAVFVASLEEAPTSTLMRIAATAAGTRDPSAHQVQWLMDAYQNRLYLWAVTGLADHMALLGTIQALSHLGVKHAVIDSLACLDIRNDDFEEQRQFANKCAAVARMTQMHLHIVAHPRKLVSASQALDLNDVAGARELGAIVDNVLFVSRGDAQGAGPSAASTPMCVSIRKQRHFNGYLGDVVGWYHRELCQCSAEQFPERAQRYLPEDAYA